jgi:surfactin synthase thioesterase subunit
MAIRVFQGRLSSGGESGALPPRLFCFPYAGAGAAIYRRWPEHLPCDVELCLPCLPARDARVDEPPCFEMATLVSSLAEDMQPWLNKPFALFGHSMGALIAFDLAHELSRQGKPPAQLFVSAQRGPGLPYRGRPIFNLPDDQFLAAIVARYQRIPQAVLDQKDLMNVLLRTFRMDFTLTEDYRYRATQKLVCPITAFGGLEDTEIDAGQLKSWSVETAGRFRMRLLLGGHFFLDDSREQLLTLIRNEFQQSHSHFEA